MTQEDWRNVNATNKDVNRLFLYIDTKDIRKPGYMIYIGRELMKEFLTI